MHRFWDWPPLDTLSQKVKFYVCIKFIIAVSVVFFITGDRTQILTRARQTLAHWAPSLSTIPLHAQLHNRLVRAPPQSRDLCIALPSSYSSLGDGSHLALFLWNCQCICGWQVAHGSSGHARGIMSMHRCQSCLSSKRMGSHGNWMFCGFISTGKTNSGPRVFFLSL